MHLRGMDSDNMMSMNQPFILHDVAALHNKGFIQARLSIQRTSSIFNDRWPVWISCPGMRFHGHAIHMNLFAIGSDQCLFKRHGTDWNYSCYSKMDS